MRKLTMLAALVCLTVAAFAQTADEETIKKTIQAEADAIVARNFEALNALWNQDQNAFTTFISRNGYNTRKGWDSIAAGVERDWKANPKSGMTQIKTENVTIRQNGNMALVDYDAVVTLADPQPDIFPYVSTFRNHNYETLVKEGDQWKITSRIITQPETYNTDNDHAVETDLNAMGYQLMAAKKMNEAIELFKMNVKLFPNSWNTYDSLGEAYATAGNKKLAIENYEKSMKLNPKSESGPPALAKLKGK